jgi:hypothetical protein
MNYFYTQNSKLIIFTVFDDYLSPELIRGDLAVCDPDAQLVAGNLVLAKIGREYFVGKLGSDVTSEFNTLILPYDGCPTLRIRSGRSADIIGRVISCVRCI